MAELHGERGEHGDHDVDHDAQEQLEQWSAQQAALRRDAEV
jgi:hypothetical protein